MTPTHRMKTIRLSSARRRYAYRATCLCGWSGPFRPLSVEARDDYGMHLIETRARRAKPDARSHS